MIYFNIIGMDLNKFKAGFIIGNEAPILCLNFPKETS
jgi:hypothetical protein